MNVFYFELKTLVKHILIWILSLVSTFAMFTLMYPAYTENEAAVTKVFKAYPPQVLDALGINIKTIFSFNGFYSFVLTYIMLMAAIMALYFGIVTIGRERRAKTSDFLFSKPLSRTKLYIEKTLAGLASLFIINVTYLIISVIIFNAVDNGNASLNDFILITASLFIIELLFFTIGNLLAVVLPKIKNIGALASSGFIFFIISMLSGIINEEWLRYFSPFKYFDANYIMLNHKLEAKYLIITFIIILSLTIFSYLRYVRKDLESV